MNWYKNLRDSRFWYTPIYYTILGWAFNDVWNSRADHWRLPQTFWQALTALCIGVVVLDSVRFVRTGKVGNFGANESGPKEIV